MKIQTIFLIIMMMYSSHAIQASQPIMLRDRNITSLTCHLNGTSSGTITKPIPLAYVQALQDREIVTFSLNKTDQENYYTLFIATPSQPLQGSFLLFAGTISPATSNGFEIVVNNQQTIPIPLITAENPQQYLTISIQAAPVPVPPISQMTGTISLNNLNAGTTLSAQALSGDGSSGIQAQNKSNIMVNSLPFNSEGNLYIMSDPSLAATDYVITAQTVNVSGTLTLSNNATLTINGDLSVTSNTSGYFINIVQGSTLIVTGTIMYNGNQNNFININGTMVSNKSITATGNITAQTSNVSMKAQQSITINGYLSLSDSATLTLNGNTTTINGYVYLSDHATLTINGDVTISEPLHISNQATLIINGSFENPSISLSNDAKVTIQNIITNTMPIVLSKANLTINTSLNCSSLNLSNNASVIINGDLSVLADTDGYALDVAQDCTITTTGSMAFNGNHTASFYNAGTITATGSISIFNYQGTNGYTEDNGNATSGIPSIINSGTISGSQNVLIYGNMGGTGGNAVRHDNIGYGNFGGAGGNALYNTGTIHALATLSIFNNQGGSGGTGIYGGNGGDSVYNNGTLISDGAAIIFNANTGGPAGANPSGPNPYSGQSGIPYAGTGKLI